MHIVEKWYVSVVSSTLTIFRELTISSLLMAYLLTFTILTNVRNNRSLVIFEQPGKVTSAHSLIVHDRASTGYSKYEIVIVTVNYQVDQLTSVSGSRSQRLIIIA